MTDLSYLNHSQLSRLNEYTAKYSNFKSFKELVSDEVNYKPVFYVDHTSNIAMKREIEMIITAYDLHMQKNNDPRRIYKCE